MNDPTLQPNPAAGIPAWLASRADSDAICLVEGDKQVRWATLVLHSRSLARGLADLGVQAGDRVGLWLPNSSAWLVTFFACAQLGAIAVSVNTRFRSAEVGDLLQRSGAKVLVCRPGFKAINFAGILAECGEAALQAPLLPLDLPRHPLPGSAGAAARAEPPALAKALRRRRGAAVRLAG